MTLLLASQQPEIKAVVVYSPAIRDGGQKLEALFNPWMKVLMEKTAMENKELKFGFRVKSEKEVIYYSRLI